MKSIKGLGLNSAREACFFALKKWVKEGIFLADAFQMIRQKQQLHVVDLQLAQEIAFGVVRRFFTIDAIIKKTLADQKMKLKPEAKILLKMAVYQLVFMDKVPVYAVVFESVELSKKYCPYQAGFINGILRKLTGMLPLNDLAALLSKEEYYSLPKEFIDQIFSSYKDCAVSILESTIARPKMTFLDVGLEQITSEGQCVFEGKKVHYFQLKKEQSSQKIFQSQKAYIQNPTPGVLIETLAENSSFETVLDLCAAPGGKLILIHLFFPNAQLFANEISKDRIKRLAENIEKYQLKVKVFNQDGTEFTADQKFDLVVIDAPCSNSGVLHKKPEARFRLEKEYLEELKITQRKLIQSASKILNPKGQIWYLTCSILKEENEQQVHSFLEVNKQFRLVRSKKIIPDGQFLDGGYAAAIQYDPPI